MFKLMGKLRTESAPETAAAIASESFACVFDWSLRTAQRDCFDDDGPHLNPLPEGEKNAKRQVSVK